MKLDYTVTRIGDMAYELYQSNNCIIIFDATAPDELAEISILHTTSPLNGDVAVGDKLVFGSKTYEVKSVGSEVNHTLKTLGHCTFVFNTPKGNLLPGQILVAGEEPDVLKAGDIISIE